MTGTTAAPPPDGIRKARWTDYLLWIVKHLRLYQVDGWSMSPSLSDGDKVFVAPLSGKGAVLVGDVVVFQHPFHRTMKMIKRVAEIKEDGGCFVIGDYKTESGDSRSFGYVEPHAIVGRVACRL